MKQNLKKINIYSNLLNDTVNSFDDFIGVKNGLDEFNQSLKDDLSINTFFKSKTVENIEKMSLFEKAVSNSMNVILVEVLKVVIENDDISLLKEVAKHFTLLSKQKLNIAFVEVVSSNEMHTDQKYSYDREYTLEISFDMEGKFSGKYLCNNIFGSYKINDSGKILIDDPASTKMFCFPKMLCSLATTFFLFLTLLLIF